MVSDNTEPGYPAEDHAAAWSEAGGGIGKRISKSQGSKNVALIFSKAYCLINQIQKRKTMCSTKNIVLYFLKHIDKMMIIGYNINKGGGDSE